MTRALTDEQFKRAGELLEVMNQRRTVIGMSAPGDAERTRAWGEYDEAQRELLEILPPAIGPLA